MILKPNNTNLSQSFSLFNIQENRGKKEKNSEAHSNILLFFSIWKTIIRQSLNGYNSKVIPIYLHIFYLNIYVMLYTYFFLSFTFYTLNNKNNIYKGIHDKIIKIRIIEDNKDIIIYAFGQ